MELIAQPTTQLVAEHYPMAVPKDSEHAFPTERRVLSLTSLMVVIVMFLLFALDLSVGKLPIILFYSCLPC